MRKRSVYSNLFYFIFVLALLVSCGRKVAEQKSEYGKATQELIKLVESNPELESMLMSSIEKARQINPDKVTNPVQSLEAYFDFISYCEKAMPWTLRKKTSYDDMFTNMFQSFCYFYFLIDQPLEELEGKGLHHNSLQYANPFASWLVTFSNSWASFLESEDSWNDEYYQLALNDPAFGLQNGWYEDPSNWYSYNDFFARKLSSPDQRPIDAPEDNSIVVSFADSEPQGVWAIDGNSDLDVEVGVVVKSASLKSISKLIGEDSQYKDAFANGTFTHSFLNVNDYHRYHFPLGGTVKEVRIIQGTNPIGGSLRWDAENNRYAFDPSSLGWQTLETRGCVILDTESYGLVALLPIGMVAVSSVNFEDYVKSGVEVKKGDMLGYFAFGGSDFIMLFQDRVEFSLDAPRSEDGQSYKHLLMGERLGSLSKRD